MIFWTLPVIVDLSSWGSILGRGKGGEGERKGPPQHFLYKSDTGSIHLTPRYAEVNNLGKLIAEIVVI